jgi:hypothetical protein
MQFDFFPWILFDLMFLIVPIFICIIFAVILRVFCKFSSSSQKMREGFTVQPPSHVIPEEYRRDSHTDGSDFRTVRLPNHCPNCGAAITHEDIDWVGPLEAKCNYCGGTVRASFEKL